MNQRGQRLRQIREHRSISQGHLARLIGVSVGAVQNYEHSRARMTDERLLQLALALRCEPADLLAPIDAALPRYHRPRSRIRRSKPY